MSLNSLHVRAVLRKELRDYRRNRFIIVTMVDPAVHLYGPSDHQHIRHPGIRVERLLGYEARSVTAVHAADPSYRARHRRLVLGRRRARAGDTRTPAHHANQSEELLLGKAAAAMIPSVAIAYTAFGVFLACVQLFAHANVATAIFHQGSVLLAQLLFTPLLAGWAIWVGIAISSRSSDVRVAQQLGMLASLPPLAITALMSFKVIHTTLTLAIAVGVGLLAIDGLAWRVVSAMFDRERLITGAKPSPTPHPASHAERRSS